MLVGQGAGVKDAAGRLAQIALLGDMEVAAQVDDGTHGLQEIEEAALAARAARGRPVRDAERAAVRQEDIDGRAGGEGARPAGHVLVGDIVRQAMALRPDAGDAGDGEASELPPLSLAEQHRGGVTIAQGGEERQVVVVAEESQDRDAGQQCAPRHRWDLSRVAPVADAEQTVGQWLGIQQAEQAVGRAVQVADGDEARNAARLRARGCDSGSGE